MSPARIFPNQFGRAPFILEEGKMFGTLNSVKTENKNELNGYVIYGTRHGYDIWDFDSSKHFITPYRLVSVEKRRKGFFTFDPKFKTLISDNSSGEDRNDFFVKEDGSCTFWDRAVVFPVSEPEYNDYMKTLKLKYDKMLRRD